jgi:hypothetical protein
MRNYAIVKEMLLQLAGHIPHYSAVAHRFMQYCEIHDFVSCTQLSLFFFMLTLQICSNRLLKGPIFYSMAAISKSFAHIHDFESDSKLYLGISNLMSNLIIFKTF